MSWIPDRPHVVVNLTKDEFEQAKRDEAKIKIIIFGAVVLFAIIFVTIVNFQTIVSTPDPSNSNLSNSVSTLADNLQNCTPFNYTYSNEEKIYSGEFTDFFSKPNITKVNIKGNIAGDGCVVEYYDVKATKFPDLTNQNLRCKKENPSVEFECGGLIIAN